MKRRRVAIGAIALAAAVGTAFAACLPDYTFRTGADGGADGTAADAGDGSFGDGSVDGGSEDGAPAGDAFPVDGGSVLDAADAAFIPVEDGGTFYFRIDRDGAGGSHTMIDGQLSHAFYIDRHEVTVRRFRKWVNGSRIPPCTTGTCSLDVNGPYATEMLWRAEWNLLLGTTAIFNACQTGPLSYGPSTYAIDAGPDGSDLPMTCVNWFDAAAFCAFEGKRLPTDLEWSYVASSRGKQLYFPWLGSDDITVPSCDYAIVNVNDSTSSGGFCKFPQPVGSAHLGVSIEGVHDLTGSLFEWVWDVGAQFPVGPVKDYTGPPMMDADASTPHVRRGGSFNSDGSQSTVRNAARRSGFPSVPTYNDVGFRCAKTVP